MNRSLIALTLVIFSGGAVWPVSADEIDPRTAQNARPATGATSSTDKAPAPVTGWAIGCKGEPHTTVSPEAFFSPHEPVTPASLYLAQLRERLDVAAVKSVG